MQTSTTVKLLVAIGLLTIGITTGYILAHQTKRSTSFSLAANPTLIDKLNALESELASIKIGTQNPVLTAIPDSNAITSDLIDRLNEMSLRLDSFANRQEQLSEQLETLSQTTASATEVRPDGATEETPLPEETESTASLYHSFDETFFNEETDIAWAESMQNVFLDGFSQTENGPQLSHVECRSTMCRLSITHDDPFANGVDVAQETLRRQSATETQGHYNTIVDALGKRTTLLYISRDDLSH